MLKLRTAAVALLSLPVFVGCGSAAKTQLIVTGTVGAGDVTGQFIAVGGPALAQSNPQQGTVTLTNTKTHAVFTVATGRDGRFAVTVPPGTYYATGRTPQYVINNREGECQSEKPVTVRVGQTVAVTVACQRK